MNEYPKIKLGEYRGSRVNEIPMSYLVWLFPTLTRNQADQKLYYAILNFFLLRNTHVEDRGSKGYFYFDDYEYVRPPGIDNPFIVCECVGVNSIGNNVYEVKFFDTNFYITEINNKLSISNKYTSNKYLYSGTTMVYEKNKDYYFIDPYGKIIDGAYLLRKPSMLDASLKNKFSENIKYD